LARGADSSYKALRREHRVDVAYVLAPAQAVKLENHGGSDGHGAQLGNNLARGRNRAARGEHVVDEQHALARLQHAGGFDRRGSVSEDVCDGRGGRRELARLTNREQSDALGRRDVPGEEESARLDSADDVELAPEGLDEGGAHVA